MQAEINFFMQNMKTKWVVPTVFFLILFIPSMKKPVSSKTHKEIIIKRKSFKKEVGV